MNPWKFKAKLVKFGEILTQEFSGLRMTAVCETILVHRAKEIANELGLPAKDILKMELTYSRVFDGFEYEFKLKKIMVVNGKD